METILTAVIFMTALGLILATVLIVANKQLYVTMGDYFRMAYVCKANMLAES